MHEIQELEVTILECLKYELHKVIPLDFIKIFKHY